MEQITLNFDASEFEAYEGAQEFFAHSSKMTRDEQGRVVKGGVQAMEMDYSPSQWSHKLNKSNNTSVTLDDADKHTEIYGNTEWIYFLVKKHIIDKKRNLDELIQLRDQLNRQIDEVG